MWARVREWSARQEEKKREGRGEEGKKERGEGWVGEGKKERGKGWVITSSKKIKNEKMKK